MRESREVKMPFTVLLLFVQKLGLVNAYTILIYCLRHCTA